MRSVEQAYTRTSEHPIDGFISRIRVDEPGAGSGDDDEVRVSIQHNIDLRAEYHGAKSNHDCDEAPRACVYRLSAQKLFALHDAATSHLGAASGAAHAAFGAVRLALQARHSLQAQQGVETRLASKLRLSFAQSALAPVGLVALGAIDATRHYLMAVYPAATTLLQGLPPAELTLRYRLLDYLYAGCNAQALAQLRPVVTRCIPVARSGHAAPGQAGEAPTHPYVPMGTWYRTRVRTVGPKPFQESGFDRFAHPVQMVSTDTAPSSQSDQPLLSSSGARVGPAPSWTSVNALVRYVLHPNGLVPRSMGVLKASPPHAHAARDDAYFDLANDDRVARLLRVSDGELLEVEQWGGWAADACPPVCGLWANVWKGTGVAMRVRAPFASLNKATAVVEMVLELGRR
eukprot:271681-Prymnesium_polylepis.1